VPRVQGDPKLLYRPELDAIRGVAIALVVLQHFVFTGLGSDRMGAFGAVGVTLFFVLSGYLITGLLIAERRETARINLSRFYRRRIARLLPALVALVAVLAVFRLPGDSRVALLYLTNWDLQFGGQMYYLVHTWTLAIEEQFYLVWPIAFIALTRWPRLLLAALVVIVLASIVFRAEIGGLMRADALGGGALLAISGRRLPSWLAPLGWIAIVALAFIPGDPADWLWTGAALGSVLVVGSAGALTWGPLVYLGTISYGLYLWNYPISRGLWTVATGGLPVVHAMLAIAGILLSIAIAVVSERWVERRFRARRTSGDEPSFSGRNPLPALAAGD
jgi:peptidoglycan/LPS O-acetylase OafA/YrhL